MIRIPALDVILEQGTLNRIAAEHLPKSDKLRSLSIELNPGMIRLIIDGSFPMLGDRTVTADLSVTLQGNEMWLRLERTNVPLVPKGAIVGIVATQVKVEGLRAEGSALVLDMVRAFSHYELETTVKVLHVDRGYMRIICQSESPR